MRFFIFPFLWTIFLTVLCGLSGNSFPVLNFMDYLSFDKMAHFLVYCVFTFLWTQAIFKYDDKLRSLKTALIICLIGIAYGIGIEVAQKYLFVGRSADIFDACANSIGSILGLVLFLRIFPMRLFKTSI